MKSILNFNGRDFLPVMFVISSFSIAAQPTVLTSDSLALVTLYNATDGPNWIVRTNWLTGPVNTWFGVTVSFDRVTELSLPENGLIGPFPADIGNLTALTSLILNNNNFFNTSLPIQVGGLINLEVLDLSYCIMKGKIPNEILNLTNLQTLMLQGNRFVDLPALSSLSLLTTLNVSSNDLTFEDIEPNAEITGIIYAPQRDLTDYRDLLVFSRLGEQVVFSENTVGGSSNVYEWVKDNGVISSGLTYTILSFSVADAGWYYLRVTNPIAPLLALRTNTRILQLAEERYFLIDMKNEIISDTLRDNPYGQAWADFDLDGDEDLFYGGIDFDGSVGANRLYENNGDGTFTAISAGDLTSKKRDVRGASWGDINNDGYPDIYVGDLGYRFGAYAVQEVEVFLNNRDKTFTSVLLPSQAGLNNQESGSWGDFNRDGYLDLLIRGTGSDNSPLTLYKNNGDNSFSIVNNPFGGFMTNNIGTLSWVDINGDNWPDIFYSESSVRALFINNQDGTFTRDLSSTLVTETFISSRGHSIADMDNDGDVDILILDQSFLKSRIFFNDGAGNFTVVLSESRFGSNLQGRASSFGDIDNDGDLDFVCLCPNSETPLFLNNGNGMFTNVVKSEQSFFDVDQFMTATLSDFNNDGFLDLFYASFQFHDIVDDRPLNAYQNVGNSNSWIKFKLKGGASNRDGIGAKVRIKSNSTWQTRFVQSQSGFGAQNPLTVHFGVGTANSIDSVIVNWPSGFIQKLSGLEVNKLWIISENSSEVESPEPVTGLEKTEAYYEIYPNPSTDKIYVKSQTSSSQTLYIQLTDGSGRHFDVPAHYEPFDDVWELDVQSLTFGIYLLNVEEKGSHNVFKVIIE